jgi:cytochrome d ubiquinol oxidase subunit II
MQTVFGLDYPTLWFLVVGFLFSGYVILEGLDYGSGMWHLFFKKDVSRRMAINAIGPLWDAHQVWLIIGGGALFAGFPVLYATLLSSMYVPFIIFLAMLVFRSAAIKFRSAEPMLWWRQSWDIIYGISNLLISFLLGVVLGNIMEGFPLTENFVYDGGVFLSFLSPYSVIVGLTTVALFLMHGAIFLLIKTEGKLYEKLKLLLNKSIIFFIIVFSIMSLYTFVFIENIADRFREQPLFFGLPVLAILSIANVPRLVSKGKFELSLLFSSLTMAFLLMLVAFQLYPVLLPSTVSPEYSINIYNAASSQKSLGIMLLIAAIGAPLILLYFVFLYSTFRGKVIMDEDSY